MEDYKRGLSYKTLQAKFGISQGTVSRILKIGKVELRNKKSSREIIENGTEIGKLKIIGNFTNAAGILFYICVCKCGKGSEVRKKNIWRVRSCGCEGRGKFGQYKRNFYDS